MSYAPEILISKDREVLRQIRSPFTNAVCWEIPGEEAETLAEHAKICDAFYKDNFFRRHQGIQLSPEVVIAENALRNFTENLSPWIDGIVSPIARYPETSRPFLEHYKKAGTTYSHVAEAHIDLHLVKAFYSFNDHMQSTSCIPREYAGKRSVSGTDYRWADESKAIAFPGMSVSIIDIGRQVHFAPVSIPSERGRILHHKTYQYT